MHAWRDIESKLNFSEILKKRKQVQTYVYNQAACYASLVDLLVSIVSVILFFLFFLFLRPITYFSKLLRSGIKRQNFLSKLSTSRYALLKFHSDFRWRSLSRSQRDDMAGVSDLCQTKTSTVCTVASRFRVFENICRKTCTLFYKTKSTS